MKKLGLAIVFLVSISTISQVKKEEYPQDIVKKHEVKANALTFIIGGAFDVSYDYIINKESSYGVTLTCIFDEYNEENSINAIINYAITPHYRKYFSDNLARGFFLEGFGMLFSGRDDYENSKIKNVTAFALGISAGKKYVSKNGFTAEFLLGFGRILNGNDFAGSNFSTEIISRGGISLGYRF